MSPPACTQVARLMPMSATARGGVECVAFAPDDTLLVTACDDNAITLYDTWTWRAAYQVGFHPLLTCVDISPDRRQIASGGRDQAVGIWDASECRGIMKLRAGVEVTRVAYSRDGALLAAGGARSGARLFDAATGKQAQLSGQRGKPLPGCFAFAACEDLLACADVGVSIFDVRSGEEAARLEGPTSQATAMAFAADGARAVTGDGQGIVRFWSVAEGLQISFPAHAGARIESMALTRPADLLATGGTDGLVRLWSMADGRLVEELEVHRGWVRSLAFSSDGTWLASGSGDKTIGVWDVSRLQVEEMHLS